MYYYVSLLLGEIKKELNWTEDCIWERKWENKQLQLILGYLVYGYVPVKLSNYLNC